MHAHHIKTTIHGAVNFAINIITFKGTMCRYGSHAISMISLAMKS